VIVADGKSLEREETSLYGAEPTILKLRLTRVADAPAVPTPCPVPGSNLKCSRPRSRHGRHLRHERRRLLDEFKRTDLRCQFDDKTYPIKGDPTKTVVNLKKISDSEVIESDSQKGQVVEVEHMTFGGWQDTARGGYGHARQSHDTFNMTKAP